MNQATTATVNRLTSGQEDLLKQQSKLRHGYASVQRAVAETIHGNIKELSKERELNSKGQETLVDMTNNIAKKLGK